MKKTKIIAVMLAMVLVVSGIVGGTIAYLTDVEGKVNIMTVGNIDIELYEMQRNDDASALEEFEQSKQLLPLVGSVQGAKDEWGMPIAAANYVDKIVYLENTGKNDAYVRVLVAIPAALDTIGNASKNVLHFSYGNRVDLEGNGAYNSGDWSTYWTWDVADGVGGIEIDGETYNVYAFTLPEVLEAGKTTSPAIAGVYLDSAVDYDDDTDTWTIGEEVIDYDLSSLVKVPVLAQAVQADGFASAEAAFAASFEDISSANNPWSEVVFVDTEAELREAIKVAGKTVTLEANIELTANLVIAKNIILDGNGFEISGDYVVTVDSAATNVAVKNVTFANAKAVEQSSLVASNYAGLLSVVNCEFTGAAWDGIQVTPVNGAKIVIKGNIFAEDANVAGERYVHIQATQGVEANIKVTVENNVFATPTALRNSAIDIDYIVKSGIKVGGNEITPRTGDVYICDVNGAMYNDLVEDFTK